MTQTQYGTATQQAAWRMAEAFRRRSHGNMWRTLQREEIANNLGVRVYDPSQIDQSQTNLCGLAALVRHWAADNPEDYVRFAINLYEKGVARLGRIKVQRNIVPSPELRGDVAPRGMAHADWLVLASIRENFNNIFDYRSIESAEISRLGEQISAINFPADVVLGLRTVGYQRIIERTSISRGQGIANALEASRYFAQGWRVILLIHSNMLTRFQNRSARAPIVRSNHWVGLLSTISTSADQRYVYPFRIFTWGREQMVPAARTPAITRSSGHRDRSATAPASQSNASFDDIPVDETPANAGLTMQDFVDHYYGFIAAKY